MEATDLEDAAEAFRARRGTSQQEPSAAAGAEQHPISSRVHLQQQLPGHTVRAVLARDCTYVDSAVSNTVVPLAMSFDVLSKDRPDGIQYRAGLHKVSRLASCAMEHVFRCSDAAQALPAPFRQLLS